MHYIDKINLSKFADSYPHPLSGGMKQRVAIGRVLANDAQLALMDEPFGALDAMTRERLQDELLSIWRATGLSVVFVTHSLEEAIFLADRIVVLSGRPSTVSQIVPVPLPRPRNQLTTREDRRFLELRHGLMASLLGSKFLGPAHG